MPSWLPAQRQAKFWTPTGEILDTHVFDDSLVCSAIEFERSSIAIATAQLDESSDCAMLGALLTSRLPRAGLAHVFVLSDGLKVNGSALVAGIVESLPAEVSVTGGLAGDGARFEQTAVCVNGRGHASKSPLSVSTAPDCGSGTARSAVGTPFGVERRITRAESNVLFELDGEPALDLYKCHIGEIQQVLLNLVVNAAHAIAERHTGSDSRGTIKISTYDEDAQVVVVIEDNGTGLPITGKAAGSIASASQ